MMPAPRIAVMVLLALSAGFGACASSSLGDPPPGERMLKCRSGETRVCTIRQPSRIGDDEPEYEFCTCQTLGRGVPY